MKQTHMQNMGNLSTSALFLSFPFVFLCLRCSLLSLISLFCVSISLLPFLFNNTIKQTTQSNQIKSNQIKSKSNLRWGNPSSQFQETTKQISVPPVSDTFRVDQSLIIVCHLFWSSSRSWICDREWWCDWNLWASWGTEQAISVVNLTAV